MQWMSGRKMKGRSGRRILGGSAMQIRKGRMGFGRVKFRDLTTIAGKRAYLVSQSQQKSGPVEKMDSREIEVSLPYFVRNHEEALDFLFHELLVLRCRIQSLLSIMWKFSIPISYKKVEKLLILSRALTSISQHIMESHLIHYRKEKKALMEINYKEKKSLTESDASNYRKKISYDGHRPGWQSTWGNGSPNCGFFDDITTLSPMHFTSCTPGIFPDSAKTGPALQIYSIKIDKLNPNLNWPLYVYGVVAARDTVDRNRNMLFCRSRANGQKVTAADPFLHLTGPSRAIVAEESVSLEVDLKIKYGAQFRDTAVLSRAYRHHSAYDKTPEIGSGCCTVKLCLKQLPTAIQATIVSIHVEEGLQDFRHGG